MLNKVPYFTSNGIKYLDNNEIESMFKYTNESEKLYHFTNFDSFVKIWLSKKLKLSNRYRMNDIAEKFDMISGNDTTKMQAYLYAISEYKQLSLSKKISYNAIEIYKSPLMWGIYANNATGVCIEFNKDDLISNTNNMHYNDITYCDYIPNNSLIEDLDSHNILSIDDARCFVDKNLENIYFRKSAEWKFENEFRIISRRQDFLNIKNSITCLYLFDSDLETKEMIYNLVGSECDIKIVYLSSIFKTERILDTFPLRKEFLKEPSINNDKFKIMLENDTKKNF